MLNLQQKITNIKMFFKQFFFLSLYFLHIADTFEHVKLMADIVVNYLLISLFD